MQTTDIKKFVCDLDRIRISQKLSYDTTVCGAKKNRNMKGELSFSFSLLKGCIAAFAALAGIFALCCAYKSSIKRKLLKKLKKKYRLVKADKKSEN